MAIEQVSKRECRCDYCEAAIATGEEEQRAAHSVSGRVNNPHGLFFSDVTATVHLCATCRAVVTVDALDSLLADELKNVTEETRVKYFGEKR